MTGYRQKTKVCLKLAVCYIRQTSNGVKYLALKLIKIYQLFISPILGRHCRFYPSCSEYAYLAVQKYGILSGLWRGIKRITRCHPWNAGGIDLP